MPTSQEKEKDALHTGQNIPAAKTMPAKPARCPRHPDGAQGSKRAGREITSHPRQHLHAAAAAASCMQPCNQPASQPSTQQARSHTPTQRHLWGTCHTDSLPSTPHQPAASVAPPVSEPCCCCCCWAHPCGLTSSSSSTTSTTTKPRQGQSRQAGMQGSKPHRPPATYTRLPHPYLAPPL